MSTAYRVNMNRGDQFYLMAASEEINRRDRLDEEFCYAKVYQIVYAREVTGTFVIPNTGLVSDDGTTFRQRFRAAEVGLYRISFHLATVKGIHSNMEIELHVEEEELEPVPVTAEKERPRIRVIRFRRRKNDPE